MKKIDDKKLVRRVSEQRLVRKGISAEFLGCFEQQVNHAILMQLAVTVFGPKQH